MRGEASRIADRVSRDSLAPKLRDSGEDAWRIGNELFTITSALDHNIQLERALTDPSRPVEDKVAVVKTLIGDQAHPLVMEIMSDLVSRRWSRVSDIANAVEDFGVDGMMYYADYTNTTLQVSIELAELHSALLNPVVRHHSAKSIRYARRHILDETILPSGTNTHNHLVLIHELQQFIKILWSCLKVCINVTDPS